MRFGRRVPRRSPPEAVVPMINVVFLLLIFFLMTAVIATPPPIAVQLPGSEDGEPARGAPEALYVSADGERAFGALRGDEALAAAAEVDGPLDVRADGAFGASELAAILADLAEAGVTETRLMTVAE